MNDVNYKNTGRIVGILFIIGTVVGVLSVPLLNPRTSPDFLTEIAANRGTYTVGALLVLIMGFLLAFIPAFMFPILKKHSEPVGIAYIVFRSGLETCTVIIRFICYLSLASLSSEYIINVQNVPALLSMGALINSILKMPMAEFAFGIGALIFYYALYRYRLVPLWLPVFGIVAILLHIAACLLVLLGLQEHFDTWSLIMNLPIAVQEMVMAVWFIVKGFRADETRWNMNEQ